MVTGIKEVLLQLESFRRISLICISLYHKLLIIVFDANILAYYAIMRKNIISNAFIKFYQLISEIKKILIITHIVR